MDSLAAHTMSGITYERAFECQKCGKNFAYLKRYVNHKKVCAPDKEENVNNSVIKGVKKPSPMPVKADSPLPTPSNVKSEVWHECVICNKKFTKKKDLIRHSTSHSKDRPYECIDCGMRFTKKMYLIRHTALHTGEKSFACSRCSYRVNRPDRFKLHMQSHGIQKPFKCTLCGEGFTFLKDLNKHLNSHNSSALDPGANTSSYQRVGLCIFNCVDCGMTFEKAEKYKYHMLKEHDVEEPYECSLCGETFSNKLHLNRHLYDHNNSVLQTVTDVSDNGTNNQNGFESGENSNEFNVFASSDEDSLDSVKDGRLDVSAGILARIQSNSLMPSTSLYKTEGNSQSKINSSSGGNGSHKPDVASGEKDSFICKKCGVQLSGKLDYTYHMKSHQNKLYGCDICGKAYTRNSNLKKHKCKGYQDEAATQKSSSYKCTTCEVLFPSAKDLDKHILTHLSSTIIPTGIFEKEFSGNDESADNSRMDSFIKAEPDDNPEVLVKHKKLKNKALVGSSVLMANDYDTKLQKKKRKKEFNHMKFMSRIEVNGLDLMRSKKKCKLKHNLSKMMESQEYSGSQLAVKKGKNKHKSKTIKSSDMSEPLPKKALKAKSSSEILEMIEQELSKYETNLSIPTVHKKEHDESVLEYEKLVVYEYMSTVPVLPDVKDTSLVDEIHNEVKITDQLCLKFFK